MALESMYFTDDYPRAGCTARIEHGPSGYTLRIDSPQGERIESYAPVKEPETVAAMFVTWARGLVPDLNGRPRRVVRDGEVIPGSAQQPSLDRPRTPAD